VYFVLYVFVLYLLLYLYCWRRPPVTVAAAAGAMAPYHRLEQDTDWEEEAEQLRLEGFTSNDLLEPEVEPETAPAPARAPAPAPASSLVQGTLLGNAATASMDQRDRTCTCGH
jgi:hypothetical protein